MKQVVQNYKSGELTVLEVPAPLCRPGGVLVRTEHSLVSAGTEKMKVAESRMSLAGMARARPDQVRKVMDTVAQQGIASTYRKVMNRLDSYTPLGYSLAGVVEEVGEGVTEFEIGQRVACGGNQFAHHAELNWVPVNLCVPVPDEVTSEDASFTTVGSIAMQAFRQSDARLGEVAVVIGLGLVGQLLVQILRGAGVHVVGIDPSGQRRTIAAKSGAIAVGGPDTDGIAEVAAALAALTDGAGADHLFLAASTDDRSPLFTAAELARDRARVVDVGKCNLDLPWDKYYEKELDVRFSRSYGPGRYDPTYEEDGIDYPIGYVRWTQRRNMKAFIDLIAEGRIDLSTLGTTSYEFEKAASVYDELHEGAISDVAVVFRYETPPSAATAVHAPPRGDAAAPTVGALRLGVIGAGNYASTMLLPHLAPREDVVLAAVATTTALSSATAQSRFTFEAATTDYRQILDDVSIDAVLVATRHDTHATIAAEAVRAGKAVFVEKPLAVTEEQLAMLLDAVAESGNDRIQVGFNRRFAPLLVKMREIYGEPLGPTTVHYDVRAGTLGSDSWYQDKGKHGTRFIGEGCHFVDTASWWLGADPIEVVATATPDDVDNLVATYRYADGSTATISYITSDAPRRFPKETLTVHGSGRSARLGNFTQYDVWGGSRRRWKRSVGGVDKGQASQIAAFVTAVRNGEPLPISFASQVATTMATFAAHESALSGSRTVVRPTPVRDG